MNFAVSSYFLSSLDEGWEIGIKKSERNFKLLEENIGENLLIFNKKLLLKILKR